MTRFWHKMSLFKKYEREKKMKKMKGTGWEHVNLALHSNVRFLHKHFSDKQINLGSRWIFLRVTHLLGN